MDINQSAADCPQFLTLKEVAARLSLSRRSVERLIAAGQLRAAKFARATRVSVVELRRFAESCVSPGHGSNAS